MHPILQKIIEQDPESPAIKLQDGDVSYSKLISLVKRFANVFSKSKPSPKILIDLEKNEYSYAAMLGAWGAGGFYCPLNISIPLNRKIYIFEKFDPDVYVTFSKNDSQLTEAIKSRCTVLLIEELPAAELTDFADNNRSSYVIFTSGSTGTPKGVQIGTAGLDNYISWAVGALNLKPSDVCSQHPNIGFDLSVLDIFAPLAAGASIVPFSTSFEMMAPGFVVQKHKINVWTSVPSVVTLLETAKHLNKDVLGSIEIMFFCGEPLLDAHVDSLFAALPDVTVINAYGPTEATVSCTAVTLTRDNYKNYVKKTVALGMPITNMSIDLEGGDQPNEGEIVISGPQVALGYWQDVEKTSEAFFEANGVSSYKTGDWAKWVDGELYFQNRIDRQCKIGGFRIDLEEIDSYLRKAGAIEAHTIIKNDALFSFVTGTADEETLRRVLAENLPDYCLPKAIYTLAMLPRNHNDKINALELEAKIAE